MIPASITFHRPAAGPSFAPAPRSRGFTLTELLVVIAIIAVLVGLLLAALGTVQQRSREAGTLATMQAFANAAETFHQEHGFYPGLVPERTLANSPQLTGTENALIHMLGGYIVEREVTDTEYTDFGAATPDGPILEYSIPDPDGGATFNFKVDISRLGEGPIIDGKAFPPYLTLREDDFGVARGQRDGVNTDIAAPPLPDVLDAWGQPLLYLRQASPSGIMVGGLGANSPVQFLPQSARGYLAATAAGSADLDGLGELGRDQSLDSNAAGSILTGLADDDPDADAAANFELIVEQPGLEGKSRGGYVIISAGADGIFFSAYDGPGSSADPVTLIGDPDPLDPDVVSEYDDVLLFGGS